MSEFPSIHIGCAGWSIPAAHAAHFAANGTHLERYGARFSAVEINSSFYRPHRPQTYAKWAASVPQQFRFAVKVPKLITHQHRLQDADEPLERFLSEVTELNFRLGPLLVQLPPSLSFDANVAAAFFGLLRGQFTGQVVCEPRHLSWFTPQSERLLAEFHIARVAADPAIAPAAAMPGGWSGLVYYRLHGTPRVYYSAYGADFLENLAATLQEAAANSITTWCIFDNTAEGAATTDALNVMKHLS